MKKPNKEEIYYIGYLSDVRKKEVALLFAESDKGRFYNPDSNGNCIVYSAKYNCWMFAKLDSNDVPRATKISDLLTDCKHLNKREIDFLIEGNDSPVYTRVTCPDCGLKIDLAIPK